MDTENPTPEKDPIPNYEYEEPNKERDLIDHLPSGKGEGRFSVVWWLKVALVAYMVSSLLALYTSAKTANDATHRAERLQQDADDSRIETGCRSQIAASLNYARGKLDTAESKFFIDLVDSLTDNDRTDDNIDLLRYQENRTRLTAISEEVDRLAEIQLNAVEDCKNNPLFGSTVTVSIPPITVPPPPPTTAVTIPTTTS